MKVENQYFLSEDLGERNDYEFCAAEALRLGREFKDARLEQMSTELALLIQKIPYDHDQFYKVIALSQSIERSVSEIKEQGRRNIEVKNFFVSFGGEKRKWSCIFSRKQDGFEIILDDWQRPRLHSTNEIFDEGVEFIEERFIFPEEPSKKTDKSFSGGVSYSEVVFSHEDGFFKQVSEHVHGSGETGKRVTFFFPDREGISGDDHVAWLWKILILFIEDREKNSSEERVLVNQNQISEASKKETTWIDGVEIFSLYKLPSEGLNAKLRDTQKNRFDIFEGQEVQIYAIADAKNLIRIILFANGVELHSREQVQETVDKNIRELDPVATGRKFRFNRIPVVYDVQQKCLLFGVGNLAEILRDSTDVAFHSNHEYISTMTLFLGLDNAAKERKKSGFIYLDVQVAHDGDYYLNASENELGSELAKAVRQCGIKLSNEMPIFRGKGSLFDHLKNYLYEKGRSDDIVRFLKETLMRSNKKLAVDLFFRVGEKKEDNERRILATASNYEQMKGIPAAGILYRKIDKKDEFRLVCADTHQDVRKRVISDGYFVNFEEVSRIDGVFRLSSQQTNENLSFTFYPVHATDLMGNTMNESLRKSVRKGLNEVISECLVQSNSVQMSLSEFE